MHRLTIGLKVPSKHFTHRWPRAVHAGVSTEEAEQWMPMSLHRHRHRLEYRNLGPPVRRRPVLVDLHQVAAPSRLRLRHHEQHVEFCSKTTLPFIGSTVTVVLTAVRTVPSRSRASCSMENRVITMATGSSHSSSSSSSESVAQVSVKTDTTG